MAYTKTNWTEATPIMAQNLNNLEQGVANALDTTTGGTITGSLSVEGLLRTESIETSGKLAFSNFGTGGGLNANIHNMALQSATGNGQMMTASDNKIYVGNPQTPLILESNIGIVANIGVANQRILTDGDSCARLSWNGSRISIDGAGNNAAVNFSDVSEVARHLHNHHNGQNLKLRASAGLGPVDGWITMTW